MIRRLSLLALIAAMVMTGQQTRPAWASASAPSLTGMAASLDIAER